MALTVKDRVKENSTTTGTADFVLGGAASGYQTFAVIGSGNTTYYAAVDQASGDWEVGIGTYSSTGPTLTRDTVLESSNAGSKVNFASGAKDVFCTYPAERSVYLDAAGSAVSVLDVGTLGVSTANISAANITAGTVSTTPTSNNDLVNKQYVDTVSASGIHYHTPVYVEVPDTAGSLNATYNNGASGVGATLTNAGTQTAFTADGVSVPLGSRVLIYNQTNAYENGVYTLTTVGSGSTNWVLTRATDADTYSPYSPNSLGQGDAFFVTNGNTGAGETYICNTVGTITFGTTAITFAQISDATLYTAGTGLTLTGTEFSITPVGTAGTYGAAATVPVITTNASGQISSVTPTAIAITSASVSGLAASATTDTTNAANISSGTLSSARLNGSYTGITGVGTLAAGTWNGGTIAAGYGGTGQSSYTVGDILYADGATSLAKLADVVTGNALISGGVGTAPAWGKVGLQTHVDGTLQVVNGGTGATTLTGYVYGNGTGAMTASPGIPNAATTATSTNVPSAIVARDGSGNFSAGTITASLSGNATSATSATLATTAANLAGGSAGSIPYQIDSTSTGYAAAGTSGQVLQSNGTSAPSWVTPTTANNGQLTLATSGTGLSGSATFTANQSGNSTFTVTSNATNLNNASTLVARDASGNFSAGTITASLSGNANSASTSTTQGKTDASTNIATTSFSKWLFATSGTGGVLDWNDGSNTIPGVGTTLLLGSATNGPGGGNYYHPFNIEYASNTGTGQITQMAIAYGTPANELYMRGRYAGSWTSWVRFLNSSNYTSYSPSLTGSGASGTWGIRITGFANQGSQRLYSTDATYNYDSANPYFGYLTYDGSRWLFQVSPGTPASVRVAYSDNSGAVGGYGVANSGSANTIPLRNGSGYLAPYSWIQFDGNYGIYSPNNSAHFYPNPNSYGSWRCDGSRNGWQGIEFAGQTTLMMNDDTYGFHRNTGGGWRFYVTGGSGYFPGNVTAYWSDERLKENLRKMDREALDILGSFNAYRFNWNAKVAEVGNTIPVGKEEIGLIAQHVQKTLPDAVVVNKAGAKVGDENFDYLTINYDRITPLLVEGVNIHEEDISSLKAKIDKLEMIIEKLTGETK